jgi:hypothetical protein
MRTFSKIVFICNICFIIAAVFRIIEFGLKKNGQVEALIPLPAVEGIIAILGFIVSFFLNIVFVSIVSFQKIKKKEIAIPSFLVIFNIAMLPIQIWYFFFFKS